MFYKIVLKSKNIFFYIPFYNDTLERAFVTCPNEQKFIIGYAGEEANYRKDNILNNYTGIKVSSSDTPKKAQFPLVENLDFSEFNQRLGTASWFTDTCNKRSELMNDFFDDTSSTACDERLRYFVNVGIAKLYKENIDCPLWAIIANHLSVFGEWAFRDTFFKNVDSLENLLFDEVIFPKEHHLTRYGHNFFKAPAYYFQKVLKDRGY